MDDLAEIGSETVEQIGTTNPRRAAINKNCSGCGAQLHCKASLAICLLLPNAYRRGFQDSSLPGFLPEELLDKAARKKSVAEAVLCRRCHLLKHHNFLVSRASAFEAESKVAFSGKS